MRAALVRRPALASKLETRAPVGDPSRVTCSRASYPTQREARTPHSTLLLDAVRAEALIASAIDLGPHVAPHSRPLFGTLNIEEQAARLVAELLMKLPIGPHRTQIALRALERAEPLAFAA